MTSKELFTQILHKHHKSLPISEKESSCHGVIYLIENTIAAGRALKSPNESLIDRAPVRPPFDLTGTLSSSSNGTQRKGLAHSPDPFRKNPGKTIQELPKSLGLPQALKSRHSTSSTLIVRDDESPWDNFEPAFHCRLAGSIVVCVQQTRPFQTAAKREYAMENTERIHGLYQQLQHENILSVKECYTDNSRFYIRVDDLPVTLEHLVLNGLFYLVASGFEHTALTCSNILLGSDRTVKISKTGPFLACHKSMAAIMMQPMHKYEKKNGVIGVDNLRHWPLDLFAVDFLTTTSSARSIKILKQHSFVMENNRARGNSIGLARLALITTKTFYSMIINM
ncbi:hypothetical protein BO85DRAFT_375936 [Aspergillus piperis CBS 112811]|uniref:Protein kinase domain-containing protein n=1 Tax=Aspergillus piperis CBS 112811 TaxID=1448313 RepID=A0A8G1QZM7_9EURO|nr:hypothetical protein BO85DRAFT_375936 [Aspergillus piperis CBS 112811]RAH55921.1 hypothetical protein BO85DRAFT_375936 [Aspergillus piperis CBS 112811]